MPTLPRHPNTLGSTCVRIVLPAASKTCVSMPPQHLTPLTFGEAPCANGHTPVSPQPPPETNQKPIGNNCHTPRRTFFRNSATSSTRIFRQNRVTPTRNLKDKLPRIIPAGFPSPLSEDRANSFKLQIPRNINRVIAPIKLLT